MGRIYRPIELIASKKNVKTVGLIDTGADETIINEKIAERLNVKIFGKFDALSVLKRKISGKTTRLTIVEEWSGKRATLLVGITEEVFNDDEGIDVILGIDFLQKSKYELKFET